MLLDGEAINLAKTTPIRNTLQNFGIEHYYKAKISQTILYIEGSTDIEMLKAFAALLDHPTQALLTDKLNYYYVQGTQPTASIENELDKLAGYYLSIMSFGIRFCQF